MSEPFIGEVRMLPYFAPKDWALCNGQLLPIAQYAALFSIIGTNYGGDGTTTFAVPNYQGSLVVGAGQGAGLSAYALGQTGGVASVALTDPQMPTHSHTINTMSDPGTINTPAANTVLARGNSVNSYHADAGALDRWNAPVLTPAGTANPAPHENLMPSLSVNFCIALAGIFPPRP